MIKTCIITGGAIRLGKAVALGLAQDGWRVLFSYRSSESSAKETLEAIRTFSPLSEAFVCDISVPKQIEGFFSQCRALVPTVDLVLCNASNFFPTPLPYVSEEDFDTLINTNLKGTFFTMQEAAKWMLEESGGDPHHSLSSKPLRRIITMTDVSAQLTWRRYAPYTASKAAIEHLVRVFAKDLAPTILVNGIAPGTMLLHDTRDKAYETDIMKKIPLARLGREDDIVSAVRFLSSADYITGHILTIDGGRKLY